MDRADIIFVTVIGIFIIFIFLIFVFPALGEATGESIVIPTITLIILAVGLLIGLFFVILDAFRGWR
jgi:hypothetical protein